MIKWDVSSENVPAKLCMFLDLGNSKLMTDFIFKNSSE